jgi:hypothetical protein
MTTGAAQSVWSYSKEVDIATSLSVYLKFLKSKPQLDEIFYYLQNTFLLDYGFDAIVLYSIDSKSQITCVEAAGADVLAELAMITLADVKKVIPATLPTQSEPITNCILMNYESAEPVKTPG